MKFFPPQHVTIANSKYAEWYKKVKNDLFEICTIIKQTCDSGKALHSTKGPGHYIQIRTKDSNPYHPIFLKSIIDLFQIKILLYILQLKD